VRSCIPAVMVTFFTGKNASPILDWKENDKVVLPGFKVVEDADAIINYFTGDKDKKWYRKQGTVLKV
jgi:hypothetical protein